MIKWKSIKTKTPKILDLKNIAGKELNRTMESKVMPLLDDAHKQNVKNWSHKVKFIKRDFSGGDIRWVLFPNSDEAGDIYSIVDLGAPPHKIRAKGTSKLKFIWGGKGSYSAKTLPNPGRASGSSGKSSGSEVYLPSVNHPGHKGRKFSIPIAKNKQPKVKSILEGAFSDISKTVQE